MVGKNFYSSGFLYHPNSQQILLQQNLSDPKSTWTLLGSLSKKTFRGVVSKLLNVRLKSSTIHPVYDYISKGKKHFVSYAEVKNLHDFPSTDNFCFSWFTAKEISKLCLVDQTKQDIVVGRRVIDSQIRKDAGERTIG